MFKITGLDELQKQLEQAQQVFEELEGELCTVSFNPSDPSSIEAAIQQINTTIDAKISAWTDNPMVEQVAEGMKEQYREAIIEKAATARLEADSE